MKHTPEEELVQNLHAEAWIRFNCDWVQYMKERTELLEALEDCAQLLEALRLDNAVGDILSPSQKRAYKAVADRAGATIAKARGE